MRELQLKYGMNPNQKSARIFAENGDLPVRVLNGRPGYINFLDALNSFQLVKELKAALGLPAAASFKHVSPAGAAVGLPLDATLEQMYFTGGEELSPLACAFARARGADRLCSYGDWIALSDVCDGPTARLIAKEFSDGVIAPGYEPEAFEILRARRGGEYNIVEIDGDYAPPLLERRTVYGVSFEQERNSAQIAPELFQNVVTRRKDLPSSALRDLTVAMISLKYTQSNSVCYAEDGQVVGVGAGQQSRIHCTRLAGDKADLWRLRRHPKVLSLPFRSDLLRSVRDNAIEAYILRGEEALGPSWGDFFTVRPDGLSAEEKAEWLSAFCGTSLGSDAFFPFGDSIERAARSGVSFVAQPGGSKRDEDVVAACDRLGIAMAFTGLRLFHH